MTIFRQRNIFFLSILLSIIATWYFYSQDMIVAYGDAESHLNIAKRVVDSVTPGFAQLGGIWLPLPHILLMPFVKFDFLWRTGLAGSIVSGIAFVVSSIYIYKLVELITKRADAAFFASLVFMLNFNVLYLQSTPMTELTLIAFFTLSSFYFISYIKDQSKLNYLLLAALFGFCATLSRYDGWFLVLIEALIIVAVNLPRSWKKMEGSLILYSTLAFFGIGLWLVWGYLILDDALYFTHSEFSAKSQQSNWLAQGMLPAYKHWDVSAMYYSLTSINNIGWIMSAVALIGFLVYIFYRPSKEKFLIALLLNTAFLFYTITLYLGQSVIFIPQLTNSPSGWNLFNVRYGVMMIVTAAIFVGFLFSKFKLFGRILLVCLLVLQVGSFASGQERVISMDDGQIGLSAGSRPDAERWLEDNYDRGLVLMDDYARTVSVVRTGIPMQEMIYIGNKPYWEESLVAPEKHATWIVVQKDDSVWKSIIDDANTQARLYTYFQKVYTSPNILIFRRNELVKN
jgi:hypothetical protein